MSLIKLRTLANLRRKKKKGIISIQSQNVVKIIVFPKDFSHSVHIIDSSAWLICAFVKNVMRKMKLCGTFGKTKQGQLWLQGTQVLTSIHYFTGFEVNEKEAAGHG